MPIEWRYASGRREHRFVTREPPRMHTPPPEGTGFFTFFGSIIFVALIALLFCF
jgi:hypothetical protein